MLRALAWMLIGGLVLPVATMAQEAPATPPAGTTPLGVRQQRVERMMEELERKFRTLRQAIEKNEPDRAKRLEETYNKAKELLIQQRMGEITKLLDQARARHRASRAELPRTIAMMSAGEPVIPTVHVEG